MPFYHFIRKSVYFHWNGLKREEKKIIVKPHQLFCNMHQKPQTESNWKLHIPNEIVTLQNHFHQNVSFEIIILASVETYDVSNYRNGKKAHTKIDKLLLPFGDWVAIANIEISIPKNQFSQNVRFPFFAVLISFACSTRAGTRAGTRVYGMEGILLFQ